MSKFIVTGGAGFIGFALAKFLQKSGHSVIIYDNLQRGKLDDDFQSLLDASNVSFFNIDLTNPQCIDKLDASVDGIFHLAAVNGTEYFYTKPDVVLKTNIFSTFNLVEFVSKHPHIKLVFSSSSEAYASTYKINPDFHFPTKEDIPLSIEDIFNPRYSYGASKLIGEVILTNYARKYQFPFSILRYHNIYGPRMGNKHVIPQLISRIQGKENPFKVYGAEQTRAFCFIDDAVKATALIMQHPQANSQVIHVGNDREEIKIATLVDKLFKTAHFQAEIEYIEAMEGSVNRRCPDIEKCRRLGYSPEISLDEGLQRTYVWYSKK